VDIQEKPRRVGKKWMFDENNKGINIHLSNGNLQAKQQNTSSHQNSSVIGNTSFEKGIWIWHVRLELTENSWIAFGVHETKFQFDHSSRGYDNSGVHSWSTAGQGYGTCTGGIFSFRGSAEIWMKMDCEKGILYAFSPTINQKAKAVRITVPVKPFFNLYRVNNVVVVESNINNLPPDVQANLQ